MKILPGTYPRFASMFIDKVLTMRGMVRKREDLLIGSVAVMLTAIMAILSELPHQITTTSTRDTVVLI